MDTNEADAPASAPEPSKLDQEIDAWHRDNFHGTRLGNDTELWNLVHRAKEELKQRLAKL